MRQLGGRAKLAAVLVTVLIMLVWTAVELFLPQEDGGGEASTGAVQVEHGEGAEAGGTAGGGSAAAGTVGTGQPDGDADSAGQADGGADSAEPSDSGSDGAGQLDGVAGSAGSSDSRADRAGQADGGAGSAEPSDNGAESAEPSDSGSGSAGSSDNGADSAEPSDSGSDGAGQLDGMAGSAGSSDSGADRAGQADSGAQSDLTFRSSRLLEQHYKKHGIEMGFASAGEYEAAAAAVVSNPEALHKQEAEDGDDVYYVEATNEFVIVSVDGYIRTYFNPSAGIAYYNRQ